IRKELEPRSEQAIFRLGNNTGLRRVVEAWPALTEHFRAAILALVTTPAPPAAPAAPPGHAQGKRPVIVVPVGSIPSGAFYARGEAVPRPKVSVRPSGAC